MNSRHLRLFGAACAAYVLVFACAWLSGLWIVGAPRSTLAWAPAALAPLGMLALWAGPTVPARRYTLNLLAATLAVPIGLLFAADALEPAPATRPSVPGLDAERLFAGAVTVQDTDLRAAGIALMRAGAFADASELRLMRFGAVDAAGDYLAMLAQAAQGEPFDNAGRRGVRLRAAGMPGSLILLEQHGADLLELRARDPASGLARLAAQQVPVAALPHAAAPAPRWPWLLGGALLHAGGFVLLVLWAARRTVPRPG
jgi:hypothetical protein